MNRLEAREALKKALELVMFENANTPHSELRVPVHPAVVEFAMLELDVLRVVEGNFDLEIERRRNADASIHRLEGLLALRLANDRISKERTDGT